MKKIYLISLLFSLCFTQDRAYIFNTGAPESLKEGHTISFQQSVAEKLIVANDYVLEAIAFWVTMQSEEANLVISIREDDNGIPGNLINNLSTWDYSLEATNESGYNFIVTTDLCIYLDKDNSYWLQIDAKDEITEATWAYSNASLYTYALNSDIEPWTSYIGYAGAGIVFAEQIFEQPYSQGDVNFDFIVNVVDIVSIVAHIMDTSLLSDEAVEYADLNSDALINVVDLVSIVSIILAEETPNPNFIVEDINPASEYFGQSIGPSFFNGQVSCYYFGKQG